MQRTANAWLAWLLLVMTGAAGAAGLAPVRAGKGIAEVDTDAGRVRGYVSDDIQTFKGIQYAVAGRFMAPQPVAKWDGVQPVMTDRVTCPIEAPALPNVEREFGAEHVWGVESEDCLRLNIWTPSLAPVRPMPVMVWFHGGGYSTGSAIELPYQDGENLSRTGEVVVVSVNHRLNILGFLDLSALGAAFADSPNAGMQDLVAALQWVRTNIRAFGGDPANVTIFGESGGGGKVSTLMLAPAAKGLFHRGIVQSGTGPMLRSQADARRVTSVLLEELALPESRIEELRTMPFERLLEAGNAALRKINQQRPAGAPTNSWSPSRDATFLPFDPESPEARVLAADVPLLVGSNKFEFLQSPTNPELRGAGAERIARQLRVTLGDRTDAFIAAYRHAYPEDRRPDDWVDVDTRFRRAALEAAEWKLGSGPAPVYMYHFSWNSPVLDGDLKSGHTIDIAFVFNNIHRARNRTGGGKEAERLAATMSRAWVQFARTGNPNVEGLPQWAAYTKEGGATMVFDDVSRVRNHHDRELLKFATGPAF